jgi:hypothetical protein
MFTEYYSRSETPFSNVSARSPISNVSTRPFQKILTKNPYKKILIRRILIMNSYKLHAPVCCNQSDLVKTMLKDPTIDPSYNGNILLILAIQHNHINIVNILINDPRVNPFAGIKPILYSSNRYIYTDILECLIMNDRVLDKINLNYYIIKDTLMILLIKQSVMYLIDVPEELTDIVIGYTFQKNLTKGLNNNHQ